VTTAKEARCFLDSVAAANDRRMADSRAKQWVLRAIETASGGSRGVIGHFVDERFRDAIVRIYNDLEMKP